jgi:hypothetical protein
MKIFNLLEVSLIFGKTPKSGKDVAPEYRMSQFTIGKFKVQNMKNCNFFFFLVFGKFSERKLKRKMQET